MACVTISGYPCSGKSTRCSEFKAYLEARFSSEDYDGDKYKVQVVSDEDLGISRSVYGDGRAEKTARASLFTAVTRALSPNTILIVDSMNYIKGFRYQIYCAAREAQVRVCTLHVASTPDMCEMRNQTRSDDTKYSEATLQNLITRYEEPSSMVRWDSPLFVLLWDEPLPAEAILEVIISGMRAPPTHGVVQQAKPPTDALQTLDQTSSAIVNTIMEAQTSGSCPGGVLPIVSASLSLNDKILLPHRYLTLSELQRHKRQFIAAHRKR
ncbi:chromatin associated protein KTI12 [Cantharellus anzutake]|uniref:chromatin associated protein KTI12 n=1 Tax=Cantharellus anzutake TaxID=1750568 RepID=UPI001906448C|nr:chromatin associated protein KTI12 [Cantharellus anzutake]KAF8325156.1 chromatin associated protein KTI12 [Cantharellus anzutake]